MKQVKWSAYAQDYDLIPLINPAYRDLVAHCVSTVQGWPLTDGDTIADIGAGTGNFSIALAQALPAVTILHADFNDDMLAIARTKAEQAGLKNWRALQLDVQQEQWGLPVLAGVVTVHCLYSFQNPQRVIQKMCSQLKPGGFIYACDVGRVMNVWDWTRYLFRESVRTRGLRKTLTLFLQSQEIRRQNQAVARSQKNGAYWTHNLAQFRACFEAGWSSGCVCRRDAISRIRRFGGGTPPRGGKMKNLVWVAAIVVVTIFEVGLWFRWAQTPLNEVMSVPRRSAESQVQYIQARYSWRLVRTVQTKQPDVFSDWAIQEANRRSAVLMVVWLAFFIVWTLVLFRN